MVNPNNKFAVVIAYYLARFDRSGLNNLGFDSFREAFRKTAKSLGVKENYVKLRRDEFDFIYSWRRGWQGPMHKQITRTIEAFQDVEEPELREIVRNLLYNKNYQKSEEAQQIENIIKEDDKKKARKKGESVFILRGPTGRKAEEFFIEYFNKNKFPVSGILIDKRDYGGGYDFEISNGNLKIFVEIKGLIDKSGGIQFTSKEWTTAKEKGEDYFLVIVRSLKIKPALQIIRNPASSLQPSRKQSTIIQINYAVSEKQLFSVI